MKIKISNSDIYWSYFAQFLSITAGIITLPLILSMLTANEIGMNYLLLSVGSLVSLFDFGFSAQFGRNISYVFGGAQKLQKEGFENFVGERSLNYKLLATMIKTAKFVFVRLALVVLLSMISFGTLYIYKVTDGFSSVKNSALIWIIYSMSVFFNIFYSYYTSLLIGKGMVKESQKAIVYSKVAQLILTFIFLYLGLGLLGVVSANFISPFVSRFLSYKYFFTVEIVSEISRFKIEKSDVLEQFTIVWHNAKKLGIVFLGAHAINKLGLFLAGLFLSLEMIGSYGLMVQLFSIVSILAGVFFSTYQPRFSFLRVSNDRETLLKEFAFSMWLFYGIFIIGSIGLLFFGPMLLSLIGSPTVLPSLAVMLVYALVLLLEANVSNFATFIVTGNQVPFVTSTLVSGLFITLGNIVVLKFTSFGLLGLVIVQGVVQLCYNNWKWPAVVFKEFNISFKQYMSIGFEETLKNLKISKIW